MKPQKNCIFRSASCFSCLHCTILVQIWSCPAHASRMSRKICTSTLSTYLSLGFQKAQLCGLQSTVGDNTVHREPRILRGYMHEKNLRLLQSYQKNSKNWQILFDFLKWIAQFLSEFGGGVKEHYKQRGAHPSTYGNLTTRPFRFREMVPPL